MSRYCVSQNGLTLLWRLTPELPKTTSASSPCSSISPRASARRRSSSAGENLMRAAAARSPAAAPAPARRSRSRPRAARGVAARRRTPGRPAARPTPRGATARTARRIPTSCRVGEAPRRLALHLREVRRVLELVEDLPRHHDGAVRLHVHLAIALVREGEHPLLPLDRPAVLLDH